MKPPPIVRRLAVLSDLARLRLLRLLDREELSVGELARILQLPQSTVSRHLKALHEGGWLRRRVEGTASLYRLAADQLAPDAADLWALARTQLDGAPGLDDDDLRLAEVLAERRTDSRAFFGRVGGEWDEHRSDLFGDAFTGEALLGALDPDWVVADVGCGTGNAAALLAPLVRRVIAIDREPAMLHAARRRLADFDNIEFRVAEIGPDVLEPASVDLVTVFLVLHHLDDPGAALAHLAAGLRGRGAVLVVDMIRHDRDTFRQTMGHRHMGFDRADVEAWCDASGLEPARFRRLRPDTTASGPGLFAALLRTTR